MIGSISTFGGRRDHEDSKQSVGDTPTDDIHRTEGLALYEHWQCEKRPDLFGPRNLKDLREGTFRRLRDDALYFAYFFADDANHDLIRKIKWLLINPRNNRVIEVSCVDRGPAKYTGHSFDISPHAAFILGVDTGDIIEGQPIQEPKATDIYG